MPDVKRWCGWIYPGLMCTRQLSCRCLQANRPASGLPQSKQTPAVFAALPSSVHFPGSNCPLLRFWERETHSPHTHQRLKNSASQKISHMDHLGMQYAHLFWDTTAEGGHIGWKCPELGKSLGPSLDKTPPSLPLGSSHLSCADSFHSLFLFSQLLLSALPTVPFSYFKEMQELLSLLIGFISKRRKETRKRKGKPNFQNGESTEVQSLWYYTQIRSGTLKAVQTVTSWKSGAWTQQEKFRKRMDKKVVNLRNQKG